ncbi:MAG: hypothetical protein RL154_641 [Pseudomonadota bacterium]|jgi:deoxyribonuclease-4
MQTKLIGAHVSTSGGVFNAPDNAQKIGAQAFAMFLKNQRQWVAKPYDEPTIASFEAKMAKDGFNKHQVLAHDSYLINLGSPKPEDRQKSLDAFIDEAKRINELGLLLLNFHPGSHLGLISEDECLRFIANSMNETLLKVPDVVLVIENTAGQGSNMGYKFEHLAKLIELSNDKSRVGICIDTCHAFTSGYDFRDKSSYEKTWEEFDKTVGFKYLRGMHINDSKAPFGSKKDRHESIGQGHIGIDAFKFLMQDERLNGIPLVLETPNEEIWADEIKMLYSFAN